MDSIHSTRLCPQCKSRQASVVDASQDRKPPWQKRRKNGKRTRAKIPDETLAEAMKLVEVQKTGAEIVSALGISLPSAQNIKKAQGLVKTGKVKKQMRGAGLDHYSSKSASVFSSSAPFSALMAILVPTQV